MKNNNENNLETNNNVISLLESISKQLNELYYANLLHDTIINSTWLNDKSFSLHGWAANYSFMYMLYRILDNVRPVHILEMGIGQTSRMTSQYIAYCNSNATLDIIENDADWIAAYQPQLAQNDNIKIHQCDLEFFTYDNTECRKYKNLSRISAQNKYDLIIIDGPLGWAQTLPRSNILDLIKDRNLADEFIIIFDDAERIGEKNTINQTIALLKGQDIKSSYFQRGSIKNQMYITSLGKSFINFF